MLLREENAARLAQRPPALGRLCARCDETMQSRLEVRLVRLLADYTTSATIRAFDFNCDVSAWAAVRIRACVKAPSRLFE